MSAKPELTHEGNNRGVYWEFNSLCHNDAIWQYISGSTLVQAIAWWHLAPSCYLNQCWFIISRVLWHSPVGTIIWMARASRFSKFSLTQLSDFLNCLICLYKIKIKNLFKSTCPTGCLLASGSQAVGNGEPQLLKNKIDVVSLRITLLTPRGQWVNPLRLRQNSHHICRWHFQMHFLEWQSSYFDSHFTEIYF